MSPNEYREALTTLNLSQESAAAPLGIGKRTSQGYALGETVIPGPTAILLRLLVAGKLSIEDVERVNGR